MSGIISRHAYLNDIFNTLIVNGEVYSSMDFSLENVDAKFYIFSNQLLDTARIFDKLHKGYSGDVRMYTTTDSLDPMFIGQRIIWKNGVWYL